MPDSRPVPGRDPPSLADRPRRTVGQAFMRWSDLHGRDDLGPLSRLLSLGLLLLPTGLLGLLAARYEAAPLVAGAAVQGLFALVFFRVHPVWRPPVSSSVVTLY